MGDDTAVPEAQPQAGIEGAAPAPEQETPPAPAPEQETPPAPAPAAEAAPEPTPAAAEEVDPPAEPPADRPPAAAPVAEPVHPDPEPAPVPEQERAGEPVDGSALAGRVVRHHWTDPTGDHDAYGLVVAVHTDSQPHRAEVLWFAGRSGPIDAAELEAIGQE